jgi:cellulose synthase/poly-beta-1,6-N-acetylglucosamine synthase-like glycosyltransferase
MKYQWIKGPIVLTVIIIVLILFIWLINLIPKQILESGTMYVGILFMMSVLVVVILEIVGIFRKPKR